jgi:hypothetical protein
VAERPKNSPLADGWLPLAIFRSLEIASPKYRFMQEMCPQTVTLLGPFGLSRRPKRGLSSNWRDLSDLEKSGRSPDFGAPHAVTSHNGGTTFLAPLTNATEKREHNEYPVQETLEGR